MQIITPKCYAPIKPGDIIVPLLGPVLGGGDWQARLIKYFIKPDNKSKVNMSENSRYFTWTTSSYERLMLRIKFVVPCRWGKDHELAHLFADNHETIPNEWEDELKSQTVWENFYIFRSLFLVFGLFAEDKDSPRADGNPYGRDTYGEIGRWTTIHQNRGMEDSILIGYEDTFSGVEVILKNIRIHMNKDWLHRNTVRVYSPEDLAVIIAERLGKMRLEVSDFM